MLPNLFIKPLLINKNWFSKILEGLEKNNTRYGGTVTTLENCTILDSKNWSCGGINGISVINGKFNFNNINIGKCPMKYEQIK